MILLFSDPCPLWCPSPSLFSWSPHLHPIPQLHPVTPYPSLTTPANLVLAKFLTPSPSHITSAYLVLVKALTLCPSHTTPAYLVWVKSLRWARSCGLILQASSSLGRQANTAGVKSTSLTFSISSKAAVSASSSPAAFQFSDEFAVDDDPVCFGFTATKGVDAW